MAVPGGHKPDIAHILFLGLLATGCVATPMPAPTPLYPTAALYMPRGVQAAYHKRTRSSDGRPGPAYWQNHGRYTIAVIALPPSRTIRGSEAITYENNSPDTLRNPVIKLFLNIHKSGAPRGGGTPAAYMTSGVHVDSVWVNERPVSWPVEDAFTQERLELPTPLMPHDSVRLSFKWHFDISQLSGREGMIDSTTWFLAYFYPRVAVYDDYNGWDEMRFTDVQEFYSDFNDYDVSITAPANYVVWGTGTLLNPNDVLQTAILDRYNRSFKSDQTIHIATLAELKAQQVTKQAPTNTWRFHAVNIPDMSFAISDHYDWDGAGVVVDTLTGRRTSAQAAYNDTASDFRRMVQFSWHSLDWLSRNWPGVPYPYEKITVVEGFAGMEYPMMVNDESYADTVFSRFVVEHEIAHTWFPFYMGINESRYAMMDEGWATTFENLIGSVDLGSERAAQMFRETRVNRWATNPSPLEDLPIITPADALSNPAYEDNAYGKAALGYVALKDMLGDDAFRTALHAFIERWHGKHPTPWDMFNTFNDVTGQDLDWFWRSWFFSSGYIDFAVRTVTKSGQGYTAVIDNVGGMPAPVDLQLRFTDGTSNVIHETAAIWRANQRSASVNIPTRKLLRALTLDGGIWMDADSTNNRWSSR